MKPCDFRELIRLTLSGMSRAKVAQQLTCSKSTIQRHLDALFDKGIPLEEAIRFPDSRLAEVVGHQEHVRSGYYAPDFDHVYVMTNIKGSRRQDLKQLWNSYKSAVPDGVKPLTYKGFHKAYQRYLKTKPVPCKDLVLTNQWKMGDVAMIDYSGDGIQLKPDRDGKVTTLQVFVGVLAGSGYIFCAATPGQTREDWLDAQIKMFDFFGGVPNFIFLDNSTSLVAKADNTNPKICREYQAFCNYYHTTPNAVRPGKPTDKGLVENAVYLVQKFVLPAIPKELCLSIDMVNTSMAKALDKLNHRPLTTRSGSVSRADLFEDEKLTLRALPPIPYELSSEVKVLTVQRSYCIRVGNRRFSVPTRYVGQKVRVLISRKSGTISVFDLNSGERIAQHYIDQSNPNQVCILPDHMPPAHRAVTMTLDELRASFESCGPHSARTCAILLEHNHGVCAKRLLRQINNWRRTLGNEVIESCSERVLRRPNPNYDLFADEIFRYIGLSKDAHGSAPSDDTNSSPTTSKNLRGADYYAKLLKKKKDYRTYS